MFESKNDRRYLTWIVVALLTLGFLAVMTQLTQSEAAEEINQDAIQDTIPSALIAGDYAIFAQARDGAAREISDDESNDSQVSVSGSDNHLFGRIRSNADFNSGGQNIDVLHLLTICIPNQDRPVPKSLLWPHTLC